VEEVGKVGPSREVERSWRLLPSERILWRGTPVRDVPRDRRWTVVPALLFALAAVTALFAALLWLSGIPAICQMAIVTSYLALTGIAVALAPRYLLDPCEYLLTDRRVLWRRGPLRRSIDRHAITLGRIRWHRSVAGVGHLELVRAVPFGPLARKQRLVLHDVKAPDQVFALVRGVEPSPHSGDPDVPLASRLDEGEDLVWGGGPDGWLVGWRDVVTALGGVIVLILGLRYGHTVAAILLGFEEFGLRVQSWTWVLFFLATGISWSVMTAIGGALVWHGVWRARALGHDTEYVLTNRRLLIRRGRTELSVDRRRIVDVAESPGTRGSINLYLILDAPHARALADNGALGSLTPPRDSVPPILYEVRDIEGLRDLILARTSQPSEPLRDAA